ncbi:IS200/IS605 family accessory protein TnpB-related protein [Dapis sp. BLCC M172]|uniref:IS200/IS605 family accessory protein TnpB-related protein n=1 Tax=Dapis sp. BLCC M172 TaxID=2975281 RepID=UPI003CEA13C5
MIGHNEEWKQKLNLGKINNQNFVSVPYNKLIEMLSYKAKMVEINVILTEESYTSASSFIDNDFIPVYKKGEKNQVTFSPKRVKRCSAAKGGFPHERLHQDKEVCIVPPTKDYSAFQLSKPQNFCRSQES